MSHEPRNHVVEASDQVCEAVSHINVHPDLLLRWPFEDLDAITGPLGNGEVWFVCAFSGAGKTTFVASCVEAWRLEGKRVFVMPLELEPKRFRTYLACMSLGIHPGDALSRRLATLPNGPAMRESLVSELYKQVHEPYVSQVRVSSQRAINVLGLENGLREAKEFGADVVIVDHIDHISGGDGSNRVAESQAVNYAAHQLAQDCDMLLLFTSQLNLDIARGGDRLAKYQPPMPQHVMYPAVKLQVCTGMVGLYRPLRGPLPGETEKEYTDAIKRARQGGDDAPDVLEAGVMGVNMMKLRNYGSNEGRKLKLGFSRGRVVSIAERDKYTTAPWGGPKP